MQTCFCQKQEVHERKRKSQSQYDEIAHSLERKIMINYWDPDEILEN